MPDTSARGRVVALFGLAAGWLGQQRAGDAVVNGVGLSADGFSHGSDKAFPRGLLKLTPVRMFSV